MLAATAAPGCYARRTPETTVLHLVVREHLETFLAAVRDERGKSLPKYVEDELRRYVRCGILAHGFVRVACPACRKEILVGMSCKCRGACPSCSARRMCGTAAHLVDRVLPDTPMRQWVLTAPFEIRRVMALRADALSACNRLFVEEIRRFRKASSGLTGAETGSVTFVQRFNSTLGVFVHLPRRRPRRSLHDDRRRRRRLPPRRCTFERRSRRRLPPRGHAHDEGATSSRPRRRAPRRGALQRSARRLTPRSVHATLAVRRHVPAHGQSGQRRRRRSPPGPEEPVGRRGRRIQRARRSHDTGRRSRRPRAPLSLRSEAALQPGAHVAPARRPRRVPPAQAAPQRSHTPRDDSRAMPRAHRRPHPASALSARALRRSAGPALADARRGRGDAPGAPRGRAARRDAEEEAHDEDGPRSSLGADGPSYARIDWASLLRRIYLEDVLACPCGGRRRIVADVTEPATITDILRHLGLDPEPPALARARDPTDDVA